MRTPSTRAMLTQESAKISGDSSLPRPLRRSLFLALTALITAFIAWSLHYGWHPRLQLQRIKAWRASPEPLVLYQTRIVTSFPLIIHISNFITPLERAYLLDYTRPLLKRSPTVTEDGTLRTESTYRTSSTAFLPRNADPVIENIRRRASEFQGYIPVEHIEIQVTSYKEDQYYRQHHDWFGSDQRSTGSATSGWDRFSTIFAILESSCDKCGTQFPLISVDWEAQEWCDVLDCSERAVTTINQPGAALYWRNLDEDGAGREDTLHAGLPATNGTKVGLNIWTAVKT
ncbi:hypothetical protein BST61_g1104 [Cercospora zeina]